MQISIVNGCVEYDGEPVLTNVNFDVRDKEKIALVGRNGCGKTTLLKVLTGEVQMIKGVGEENFGIFFTGKPNVGYLKQVVEPREDVTLFDEVKKAYKDALEREAELNAALKRLEYEDTSEAVDEYVRAQERYEIAGGYTYLKECEAAIRKFGFSKEEFSKPLSEFSGGQRTKISLLKLLLSRPEVLLLDEPTNHLDVEAVEWLENYLKNYKNSLVIVSHDRMFLDRVVNVVYEIEYGETTRYKGNYSAFVLQKKANYEKARKDAAYRKKEAERLMKVVERFRYKATKAAMAQSKLLAIKRLGDLSEPDRYDMRTFHADFQPLTESVRKTFFAEKLVFGYDKPLGEVTCLIERGDKLGIIGGNGCGKSTFVKTIMGIVPKLSGAYGFGLHAEIGYFDQTATQIFSDKTVFDYFHDEFPRLTDTETRSALGAFNITGDDVFKRVGDLSGGEKVRLSLCRILKRRPNVLGLDEPTNHMDIVGKETFEDMLKAYKGTVIVVSHDRYLINSVCNKILAFGKSGAKLYPCGYEEYERQVSEKEVSEKPIKDIQSKAKQSFTTPLKEKQKREKRVKGLEEKITACEEEAARLKERLALPEVCSDYVKIMEIEKRLNELNEEINALLEELETAEKELSELTAD